MEFLRNWRGKRGMGAEGNVATLFALSLPIIIGAAAFGVETSYWFFRDLKLQSAADAAAYAGAIEKRAGSSNTDILASAVFSAEDNGFDGGLGTMEVNSPPTSGLYSGGQAVEVILSQPVERFFTKLFLDKDATERVRAVARFQATGKACILALDPSASSAVLFSGNTSFNVKGCNVMANSIATDAIQSQGSVQVALDCIVSGGGTSLTAGVVQALPNCPILKAPPVGDPYSDLPVPLASDSFVYKNGLDIKGTVNLAPGVYIIRGNKGLTINAGAVVTGTGVTFYLEGTARVTMNGTATVKLQAPTSGTYAGVLFFGDRNNSGTPVNKFNGTADSELTGTIYFRSQPVAYAGNFSGQGGCTRVVADTIEWTGSTTLNQDCTKLGMKDVMSAQIVKLAE
jgi:hypothetical protein